jgi:hypothetical protein
MNILSTRNSEVRQPIVRRFIDWMQEGPRRKKISQGIIISGDLLGVVAAFIALYAAARGIRPQNLWLVALAALISILVAFAKIFKHYFDKRKNEIKEAENAAKEISSMEAAKKLEEGILLGITTVYTQWSESALMHRFALQNSKPLRSLNLSGGDVTSIGREATLRHLSAVRDIFTKLFPDAGTLIINLMMVNRSTQQLWLVMVEPGRKYSRKPIPRSYPIEREEQAWGANVCLDRRQMVYTAEVPNDGEVRDYCSVINLPLFTPDGEILALVNVDSALISGFGVYDDQAARNRLELAEALSAPILESLSLLLIDKRLFVKNRDGGV